MAEFNYPGDLWTLELELLGFEQAGEELVSMAAYGDPPFAVGVFGKWGSGKTSILRYCMARLGGELIITSSRTSKEPYNELLGKDLELEKWNALRKKKNDVNISFMRSIWFNPWQYQNEPNPLVPLLYEIRSQMSDWLKYSYSEKIYTNISVSSVESGIELISRLIEGATKIGLGSSFGVGKLIDRIRNKSEQYEEEHFGGLTDSQRFSLLFEKAVQKLLGGDKIDKNMSRLVIFIDDLDRCEDEHILHLLEALKLYLNSRYCVFVLGLDPTAVERALKRSHSDKTFIEIREYLEKLFQGIIHVPTCQDYEPFIKRQMKERELNEKIKTVYKEGIAALIASIIEPNPRKVKNFLNAFQAFRSSLHDDIKNRQEFDDAHLVLILYLKLYYPDVYRTIEYEPENLKTLINVLREWRTEIRDSWPLAAFYAHAFSHILDIGNPAATTAEAPLEIEGQEVTKMPATGKIDEKSFLEAVTRGHDFMKDILDRHKGDKNLGVLLPQIFNKIGEKDYLDYLTTVIKPARASQEGV
jgi:hypothetical protein